MLVGVDDNFAVGKFLREHRRKADLSQRQVSNVMELKSSQFISNIERGVAPVPTYLFIDLLNLYKVSEREVVDFLVKEQKKSLNRFLKEKRRSS